MSNGRYDAPIRNTAHAPHCGGVINMPLLGNSGICVNFPPTTSLPARVSELDRARLWDLRAIGEALSLIARSSETETVFAGVAFRSVY